MQAAYVQTGGGWIKSRWDKCTREFHLSLEKDETVLFSGEWIELEAMILSEINQSVVYSIMLVFFFSHVDLGEA